MTKQSHVKEIFISSLASSSLHSGTPETQNFERNCESFALMRLNMIPSCCYGSASDQTHHSTAPILSRCDSDFFVQSAFPSTQTSPSPSSQLRSSSSQFRASEMSSGMLEALRVGGSVRTGTATSSGPSGSLYPAMLYSVAEKPREPLNEVCFWALEQLSVRNVISSPSFRNEVFSILTLQIKWIACQHRKNPLTSLLADYLGLQIAIAVHLSVHVLHALSLRIWSSIANHFSALQHSVIFSIINSWGSCLIEVWRSISCLTLLSWPTNWWAEFWGSKSSLFFL